MTTSDRDHGPRDGRGRFLRGDGRAGLRLRGHAHGMPVPLASMPRTCPLGHQLGPGRVLTGWHPCDCPPAGRPVCGPRSCHAGRSPRCVTPPATRSCPRHGRRLGDPPAGRPVRRADTGDPRAGHGVTRWLVSMSTTCAADGGWARGAAILACGSGAGVMRIACSVMRLCRSWGVPPPGRRRGSLIPAGPDPARTCH